MTTTNATTKPTIDDYATAIIDVSYETLCAAQEAAGHAQRADAAALTDPAVRAERLASAREAAAKASRAADWSNSFLSRARDIAHGARAAARKAGRRDDAAEAAVTRVESSLRDDVKLAQAFAATARSFASAGLRAHDRQVTFETIARLRAEASSLSNKLGEHARMTDLLADANDLCAQLAE